MNNELVLVPDLEAEPEFASVETFVEEKFDNDETSFTHVELSKLAGVVRKSHQVLKVELAGYGLTLKTRAKVRSFRTLNSNPHNRWSESGNHGGSGGEQITGFAGRVG